MVPDLEYSRIRFVAYSYPKLAVQFLSKNREVLMLELGSWKPVPAAKEVPEGEVREPEHFERWSLLDEMPQSMRRSRRTRFAKRAGVWGEVAKSQKIRGIDTLKVQPAAFAIAGLKYTPPDPEELGYWKRPGAHGPCYELSGQETEFWCVAASIQMVLGFFRYEYSQSEIAKVAGLGTLKRPRALEVRRVNDIIKFIKTLSCGHLEAGRIDEPEHREFRREIDANLPLISIIPGHARTVAGYYHGKVEAGGKIPFDGLLVYDPSPPSAGAIHRYENFNVHTHRYAFTVRLKCP
jgi:hypothetical protein